MPFFGDLPLSQIASFDIERYKKRRTAAEFSPAERNGPFRPAKAGTVNRELAALSHLFSKAVESRWIDHRPAIGRLKEGSGRTIYLTSEQATRLVEASKRDQNPQIYFFILIGLHTGMRRSEILSIRRTNLNLNNRTIFLPHAKAGAREQPITAELLEVLRSYVAALPPGSPWLFPSLAARGGHTVEVWKAFRRVVVDAGLDPDEVTPHTLRHTAITHLVQAGVDLPTVKRISGHRALVMVERYAHQNGAHIACAMDKLEDAYRSKVSL